MIAQANCRELPLAANSVDLIFTDPPYLREFLPTYGWLAREAMRVLKPGGFVLAMCGGMFLDRIYRLFGDAGLSYFWHYAMEMPGRQTGAVWHYGQDTRNPITVHHKAILAWSKGVSGPRVATTDVFVCNGRDKTYHHWGQDVASARYFVDCFSAPGDLVLDPFVGGGTTLMACDLIGRRGLGFDLEPAALATTALRMANSDAPRALPLSFAEPTR